MIQAPQSRQMSGALYQQTSQQKAYPGASPRAYQQQQVAPVVQHTDIIHDIQYDYYGQQLATASSDRTIGIYNVSGTHPPQRKATLTGHKGPVWMVSWANPVFGNVIASVGYDRRAIIWKETESKQWIAIHIIDIHRGSVNTVHWGPREFGALVATGSSDGSIAITSFDNGCWQESYKISNNDNGIAHAMGVTSVSFAPFSYEHPNMILLASGGCDRQVRIWHCQRVEGTRRNFSLLYTLERVPCEKVADVAFCPSCAASRYVLLASGHDKTVVIHRKPWKDVLSQDDDEQSGSASHGWERSCVTLKDPVWRLSWSPCGELLLVTTVTSEVHVLREGATFTDRWLLQPIAA